MSDQDKLEHPPGSVQGLCSAAMTMLALLIAFLGYTSFRSPDPWSITDLWIQILPAILGAICLVLTPMNATKLENAQIAIQRARNAFAIGSTLALLAIILPMARDFYIHRQDLSAPGPNASRDATNRNGVIRFSLDMNGKVVHVE